MAVGRAHFRERFSSFPAWNCPHCENGFLKELPKGRSVTEPIYSKSQRSEDWWEPDHTIARFAAEMRCTNSTCGECVFVTGHSTIDYYGQDEEGEHWEEIFEPRAAYPAIPVFRLMEEWPDAVITELRRSFAHIWNDPGAAANRLRTAVECLLDGLRVKKTTLTTKGGVTRRSKLKLHDRIVAFRAMKPDAADLLLAVKWLGNAGSHADLAGLTRDHVLDGMEIMEHVLHLLFDKTGQAVTQLAKSINKKKGPVSKPKNKSMWS
jgi:hypothetical protein